MIPFPDKKYGTIVADPPWPYNNVKGPANAWHSAPKGMLGSALHYGSMSIPNLCALSIQEIAEESSHLYVWTTNSFLVEAHEIARAWGFEPKTVLTWVKIKSDNTPSMKAGHYYRSATEHCLFAVRGRLRLKGPCRPTAFMSQRLPHSVKPEWFYELVEEQSPAPYLELFARHERSGWDSWGDQTSKEVEIEAPLSELEELLA